MPYFRRLGPDRFDATEAVSGAWNEAEQHIAPALGLLVHLVETDLAARRPGDDLLVGRLSFDILGVIPVDRFETSVEVLRPGRTIELAEAVLTHGGRAVVRLRAWLMAPGETAAQAGTPLPGIEPPEAMPAWDATTVWPGGYIASVQVRRREIEPGRAAYWVRTATPLLDDEPVSPLASAAALFDVANGMTVRVDPRQVAFPNLDLTAHLLRRPHGEWVGFDTSVSFGPSGIGITSSVLHDITGPFGSQSQILTVRPAAPSTEIPRR